MTAPDTSTCSWSLLDRLAPVVPRLLLHGPPGTGKTSYAVAACRSAGHEPYIITLSEETPAAELRGHYVLGEGGQYRWHDGPVSRAWREGGIVVLNEIDHASPDALSYLYGALDAADVAAMTLPTGETIRPAPGFRAIATCNGRPEDLPEALVDRFTVKLALDTWNPAALAVLPPRVRRLAEAEADSPSLRPWFNLAALLKAGVSEDDAARAIFHFRSVAIADALALADDAHTPDVDNE